MSGEKGWVLETKKPGATYYGQWMRVSVHAIHGCPPEELYVTCHDVAIDCFKLKAAKLGDAQYEALMLVSKMMKRYGDDVTKALRSRSME